MDQVRARTILGVGKADTWEVIRASYRTLIRRHHPDVADGDVARAAEINEAYRTLVLARREAELDPERDGPSRPAGTPSGPGRSQSSSSGAPRAERREEARVDDVRRLGGDTLAFASTPGETFRRLVEGVNRLGDISYIDRSAAILEAVMALQDGTHASFVASLQWRAHDATCEAFCTLEALDRAEHLDVSGVLDQLLELLPPDREFT